MLVGYARVSTTEQSPELQRDALEGAGCKEVFWESGSGAKADRPGLKKALDYMREGDVLVVWKLDRLGRSLKDLIEIVNALQQRGIGFKSLTEQVDTTTSGGRLVFHIFGALAEFEREVIRERTQAGLAAARARGRRGGRPRVMDEGKVRAAKAMLKDPETSIGEVCQTLGVSRATLYRYVGSGGTGPARFGGDKENGGRG